MILLSKLYSESHCQQIYCDILAILYIKYFQQCHISTSDIEKFDDYYQNQYFYKYSIKTFHTETFTSIHRVNIERFKYIFLVYSAYIIENVLSDKNI